MSITIAGIVPNSIGWKPVLLRMVRSIMFAREDTDGLEVRPTGVKVGGADGLEVRLTGVKVGAAGPTDWKSVLRV